MNNELKTSFEEQAIKTKFNKEVIPEIEKYFSASFDEGYKNFLLNYGSVLVETPEADSFIIKYEEENILGDVLNFLSFQEMIESYKLLREDMYEGGPQIPEYMIPIAHMNDSYARDYVLINKNDNSIWATKESELEIKDIERVAFVSKNFEEFINSLDSDDNIEEQIEILINNK